MGEAQHRRPAGEARLTARLLWAALLAACVAACLGGSTDEPVPQAKVSESWQWNRRSPGHVLHLDAQLHCDDCHKVAEGSMELRSTQLCQECHAEQLLHHGDV